MAILNLGQVVGPPGPKGDTGSQGIQGVPGIQGPKGDDGLTTSVNGVSQVGGAVSLTQDNIPDGITNKTYTATEKTKLAGIATGANKYVHPTTAGNKHIPTGGTVGQIMTNSASGTAVWGDQLSVVNGLAETVAGKALDATQGKILNDLISTKSSKSTIVSKTLATASWTGASAPYSYSLTVTGVTATSVQEVMPTIDITAVQLEALQAANIQDGGQSANTIILKAWGTKPTIDIPIRVIIRGDM